MYMSQETIELSLTDILADCYNYNKVTSIEQFGYIKDLELSSEYSIVYLNENIMAVVVILPGYNLPINWENIDIVNSTMVLLNSINSIKTRIKNYEDCIEKVIKKYENYNTTFLGGSIGGKTICEKIKGCNTNIKGYTYNSVLVYEKASDNITNHRVLTDLLSLNILLFEKTTKQIFIPYMDYVLNKKNNNNFINYLFESHLTSIIAQNPSKQILIPIAFCKS